ncbi:MAG TPA: hypothetical protein VGG16_08350 [Streptosporangiaceae bacterium]|jgi:hypothetical protein
MSSGIGFPDGGAAVDLDVAWIHGSAAAKYNTDPDIQVHAGDEHTYILRQNMAVHYEAPFMFLLFGADRAVLIDTGPPAPDLGHAQGTRLPARPVRPARFDHHPGQLAGSGARPVSFSDSSRSRRRAETS